MTEKWRSAIDAGKSVGVIFIDFKKAFDSVSHHVLFKKLNGISGQFHQYIESYLENRPQFTVINGVSSKEEKVDFGVPQGSLLGPPCFSINVNDITTRITTPHAILTYSLMTQRHTLFKTLLIKYLLIYKIMQVR